MGVKRMLIGVVHRSYFCSPDILPGTRTEKDLLGVKEHDVGWKLWNGTKKGCVICQVITEILHPGRLTAGSPTNQPNLQGIMYVPY